jgi:predicted HD phosphohydrolase
MGVGHLAVPSSERVLKKRNRYALVVQPHSLSPFLYISLSPSLSLSAFFPSLVMAAESRPPHLLYLFELLSEQNQSNYIGENISQLAHSLQAAHLATLHGCNEETAIAALLHDIGQILPMEAIRESLPRRSKGDSSTEDDDTDDIIDERGVNVGRAGHEWIGECYLRSNGWPDTVCRLVGAHVIAKR